MKHWANHPGVRTGEQLDRGERAADASARWLGSWRFLIGQTVAVAAWIVLNLVAWGHHWDPYPFILLNLAFSTQAAYATPLILLAQHRNDVRTAEVADHTLENTAHTDTVLTQVSVDVQRLWATVNERLPAAELGKQVVDGCED